MKSYKRSSTQTKRKTSHKNMSLINSLNRGGSSLLNSINKGSSSLFSGSEDANIASRISGNSCLHGL